MKLRCVGGPRLGDVLSIDERGAIFGRNPQDSKFKPFQLSSKTVSRLHCSIEFENSRFVLKDLGSANGTRVNKRTVEEQVINDGDRIDIGEFSFVVENKNSSTTNIEHFKEVRAEVFVPTKNESKPILPQHSLIVKVKVRILRLDFNAKIFGLLMIAGIFVFSIIYLPVVSDARAQLFRQAFISAREATRVLAERNKRELAQGQYFLLDCDTIKKTSGVQKAFLLDSKGKPVCPIGVDPVQEFLDDFLTEAALYRGEVTDDCEERIIQGPKDNCDLVFPVREWRDDQAQYATVGISRVRYQPIDALQAAQSLRTTAVKVFVLAMLALAALWALIRLLLRAGVNSVIEGVRVAASQSGQRLESIEGFADFDPLLSEVQRLINKSNQQVTPKNEGLSDEASFLQPILQQVLVLEDRPVMIVNKDNQIMAASNALYSVLPVNESLVDKHVTEIIQDAHLQEEMMSLLNDVTVQEDSIDRALSSADHVWQVRAVPMMLRGDCVATFLIF